MFGCSLEYVQKNRNQKLLFINRLIFAYSFTQSCSSVDLLFLSIALTYNVKSEYGNSGVYNNFWRGGGRDLKNFRQELT